MATLTIRDARDGDAPAIAGIRAAIVADPLITFTTHVPSQDEIRSELAALRPYLVAEEGGACLGYAFYKPFRAGPGYAHTMEHTIHLDSAARGRRIGRALMAALEDRAAAAGVHVLVAGIGAGNLAGIAFHKACGFIETGRMPEVGYKGGQWHDLVLMQKRLYSQ